MAEKRKKNTGKLRVIAVAIIFMLVIILVALVIKNGGLDIRKLWRQVAGNENTEYYYENSAGGSFATVGDGFAVLSAAELYAFDRSGEETVGLILSFSQPELSACGDFAAAWDLGGRDIILFSEKGLIKRLQTDNTIISVTVNEKGYMCVCTEEAGYGGSVTVYNLKGTAIYKWSSGSAYVLSARLKDNSELIVLTIGKSGSSIVLLRTDNEEEQARYTYDGVVFDAVFSDNGIMAISDSAIIFLNKLLEEKGTFDFSEKHLDAYILNGDFAVAVTGDYQIGGEREIISVDSNGDIIGSTVASEEVLSLDASENYIAVLFSGRIDVYDYRMQLYTSYESLTGTEAVLLRENGSVIAAGAYSAVTCSTEDES